MKSYSIRDSIGNQSHLILPVVLASIALTGIGFAIAALVGTGSDATAADPAQTLTIRSTISGSNITVSHTSTVKKHVVKGKVVTSNGVVTRFRLDILQHRHHSRPADHSHPHGHLGQRPQRDRTDEHGDLTSGHCPRRRSR